MQTLTGVIKDRKEANLKLISLIIRLFICFSNVGFLIQVKLGKSYVCFHASVYSYSRPYIVLPISENCKVLHSEYLWNLKR